MSLHGKCHFARKKLSVTYFDEASKNRTPLKQMSIVESFKQAKLGPKAKISLVRFREPTVVSAVPIEISDSDSDREIAPVDFSKHVMSPPKIPKTNIGVFRPKGFSPTTTMFPNVESTYESLEIKNSPDSLVSNTSIKTEIYDYSYAEALFDEATMEFPDNKLVQTSDFEEQEKLIINDPMDFIETCSQNIPNNFLDISAALSQHRISQQIESSNSARRKLMFDPNEDDKGTRNVETVEVLNPVSLEKNWFRKRRSKHFAIEWPEKDNKTCVFDTNCLNNMAEKPVENICNAQCAQNLSESLHSASTSVPSCSKIIILDNQIVSTGVLTSTANQVKSRRLGKNTKKSRKRKCGENSLGCELKSKETLKSTDKKIKDKTDKRKVNPLSNTNMKDNSNTKQLNVQAKNMLLSSSSTNSSELNKTVENAFNIKQIRSSLDEIRSKAADKDCALSKMNIDRENSDNSKSIASGSNTVSNTETSTSSENCQNSVNECATPMKHVTNDETNSPSKVVIVQTMKLINKENVMASEQVETVKSISSNEARIIKKIDNQTPSCSKESTSKEPVTPLKYSCTMPKKQSPSKRAYSKKRVSPIKRGTEKSPTIKTFKAKQGKQLQEKQLNELTKLIEIVLSDKHRRSLLSKNEVHILSRFKKMTQDQKYIIMKLFIWQKRWYNIFTFCKKAQIETADDKDIIEIFKFLNERKFVETDYKRLPDMEELLNQLEKQQIKDIVDELRIMPNKGTKNDLIQFIVKATRQQTTLTKRTLRDTVFDEIEKKMGHAFKIRTEVCDALSNTFILATFVNKDFEDINTYFRDIIHSGVVFPDAKIDDYLVFYSRTKFLDYIRAVQINRELDSILKNKSHENKWHKIYHFGKEIYDHLKNLEPNDCQEHTEAPHLKKFTAEYVYCAALTTCCENIFTKQRGKPEEVKNWLEFLIKRYPRSRKIAKWYYRLIWLHIKHLDTINIGTGVELLIKVLSDKDILSLSERALTELGDLGKKLKMYKKCKLNKILHDRLAELVPRAIDESVFPQEQIDSRCIRSDESGRKRIYITKSDQEISCSSVEQVALNYYAQYGYPNGEHCEGSLIKNLMVLYFWDIIYNCEKHIPGAFISNLQYYPLDMFTHHFYRNRQEIIDKRLKEIGSEWLEEELIEFGTNNWQLHSYERSVYGEIMNTIKNKELIRVLVEVIGRQVLTNIFERLIKNIREYSSGMPDLLIWNVDKKIYKFVEVKGEGDRLAPNQKVWLKYLKEIGASIEVCWVHSLGSKRKKIKHRTDADKTVCNSTGSNDMNKDTTAMPENQISN